MTESNTQTPISPAEIDATLDVMRAALECENAHVFLDWCPHVEMVWVRASPNTTRYEEGEHRQYLMEVGVYVGSKAEQFEEDPLPTLRDLAQQIREL